MNFPLYIARRYLVSKKSHNTINIISLIATLGVTIGTMALIIVLSVFNGFERLVESLYSTFDPDILVTVKEGKTFDESLIPRDKLERIPGVLYITEILEENALLKYQDKQYIVTLKGVGEDFMKMSRLDTMIPEGKYLLRDGDKDFAILGAGVAYDVNANLEDYMNPLIIYVPNRFASMTGMSENAFNSEAIFPSGVFSVQEEFDNKFVIVPLRFAKKLLDYKNEITGLAIGLAKEANTGTIQEQVRKLAGNNFLVRNRFQQQELLYKIMKSEKWAIFLILTFILLIATFNVIGSLSMLILDKKKDIAVLQSLGADHSTIKKIFLAEGTMISVSGAMAGLILGIFLCWLQQTFGFVKLGNADSTFVVNAYPVHMEIVDFIFVFITVNLIGLLAAWYPVHNIRKISTTVIREE